MNARRIKPTALDMEAQAGPVGRLCIWWLQRQNYLVVKRQKSRTETLAELIGFLERESLKETSHIRSA